MSASAETVAGARPVAGGRGFAYYALGLLLLVYVFNFIDRQILSILMESIRKDLHLTDTQLGLLSGLAFAVLYAILGIPLASLADRASRRTIIAAALGVWSLFTAACGMAQGFGQLLLCRMGVAVGEAGCSPAAHSLIADLFPHGKRSMALALYATGTPIGVLIGLGVGGWLNDQFSWRVAFMVVGLPGILLAILAALTLKEPARGATDSADARRYGAEAAGMVKSLLGNRSFVLMALAASFHAFTAYGALQWNPAFMIRVHHLTTAQTGLALGLVVGTTGVAGTLLGGWMADRLGRRDGRWYALTPALLILAGLPFYIAAYWVSDVRLALALLFIPNLFGNSFTGPVYGAVQGLAPLRMRAMAAALLLFVISMIGLGLGPFAVGLISDLLKARMGADTLRGALNLIALAEGASIALFLLAARRLGADLAAAGARVDTFEPSEAA